jgi:hypothetical protein
MNEAQRKELHTLVVIVDEPAEQKFQRIADWVDSLVEQAVAEAQAGMVERCAQLVHYCGGTCQIESHWRARNEAKAILSLSPDPGYVERERLKATLEEHKTYCRQCVEDEEHKFDYQCDRRLDLERRLQGAQPKEGK